MSNLRIGNDYVLKINNDFLEKSTKFDYEVGFIVTPDGLEVTMFLPEDKDFASSLFVFDGLECEFEIIKISTDEVVYSAKRMVKNIEVLFQVDEAVSVRLCAGYGYGKSSLLERNIYTMLYKIEKYFKREQRDRQKTRRSLGKGR